MMGIPAHMINDIDMFSFNRYRLLERTMDEEGLSDEQVSQQISELFKKLKLEVLEVSLKYLK